jgi:hypothetical protein
VGFPPSFGFLDDILIPIRVSAGVLCSDYVTLGLQARRQRAGRGRWRRSCRIIEGTMAAA